MSTLLEVFGKKGYAQHRLPPLKNADYSFWLSPWEFRTKEPLRISLEKGIAVFSDSRGLSSDGVCQIDSLREPLWVAVEIGTHKAMLKRVIKDEITAGFFIKLLT